MEFISNDLLKSAELTGIWEKKLREIETGDYDAASFMDELKQMVSDIVFQVKADYSKGKIIIEEEEEKTKSEKAESAKKNTPPAKKELSCPKCGSGIMMKGNSAWGCSNYAIRLCVGILPAGRKGRS